MVDLVSPNYSSNGLNDSEPLVMHVDLNSCFASVEQQARPKLRGRPVVIINRACDKTSIITASYEAKALGVKTLMKLSDARRIIPDLIAIESDPAKYRFVYRQLLNIMQSYSAHVTMKSIDEGVIDFDQATNTTKSIGLENIAYEIKKRLQNEIGIAMRCNIGISTNRFLAKTAASLHKPDGLDIITSQNLYSVFQNLKLTDLTGIANRNQARLNAVSICTPLDFLNASEETLRLVVFKSIDGTKWHQRLRGFEVDDISSEIGRVGRQYVLESFNLTQSQILQRLHHLCESVGWRMRSQGKMARGVYIYVKTNDKYHSVWHNSKLLATPFFSNQAIFTIAKELFSTAPTNIKEIGIHCYKLSNNRGDQLVLFADKLLREESLSSATDKINHRYGERAIVSADTITSGIYTSQKIPFGSTRYL